MSTAFQEPFAAANKAALANFQAVASTVMANFEKLVDLNVKTSRDSLKSTFEALSTPLSAKDFTAFNELAKTGSHPAAEQVLAYSKQLYGIAQATGTDLAALYERQVADARKNVSEAISKLAQQAPAGTEAFIAPLQQAAGLANQWFDQAYRAGKQAASSAEANFVQAVKATERKKK